MNKQLLVCDLDNTLYDWVSYFISAFYAMVDEVVRITNCDRERLLDDFRSVHKKYHDSEHPFALLETRTVQEFFPGLTRKELAERLDSAFHAFNKQRKRNLHVYEGVRDGLEELSRSGVVLVAHTESRLFAVVDRLTRLELSGLFERIYCREGPQSGHPHIETVQEWLDNFPMEKVVQLSHHQRKPDRDVLLEICRNEGVAPEDTAYVGDSVARDVLMAKMAGVFAIWAKYGSSHTKEEYQRLVRVTHWTKEDVAREYKLKERAREIRADYVLNNSFSEILDAIRLVDQPSVGIR